MTMSTVPYVLNVEDFAMKPLMPFLQRVGIVSRRRPCYSVADLRGGGGGQGSGPPSPLMGQHPISRDPTSPDLVHHKCKISYLKFLNKYMYCYYNLTTYHYIPCMNIHWDTMVYPQHAHPSHPHMLHCRSGE